MDVKRLLWPTDFSENAAQALPVVTSLAQKYPGKDQYGYGNQKADHGQDGYPGYSE